MPLQGKHGVRPDLCGLTELFAVDSAVEGLMIQVDIVAVKEDFDILLEALISLEHVRPLAASYLRALNLHSDWVDVRLSKIHHSLAQLHSPLNVGSLLIGVLDCAEGCLFGYIGLALTHHFLCR